MRSKLLVKFRPTSAVRSRLCVVQRLQSRPAYRKIHQIWTALLLPLVENAEVDEASEKHSRRQIYQES
jgi:hypothetical protein